MQNKHKYKHPTNTLCEISRLHFSLTRLHGLALVLSQRPVSSDVVCYYQHFTLLSSYGQRGLGEESARDSRITNGKFWTTLLTPVSQQNYDLTETERKWASWMVKISSTMARTALHYPKVQREMTRPEKKKNAVIQAFFSKSFRKIKKLSLFYNIISITYMLYSLHKNTAILEYFPMPALIACETTVPMLLLLALKKLVRETFKQEHWF